MPRFVRGRIALEQQRSTDAMAELDAAMALCFEGGCSPRISEEVHYDLGRAHDQLGHMEQAVNIYRKSLSTYELLRGPNNIGCLKRRLSLADALRRVGRTREASELLAGLAPGTLEALPPPHLVVAEFRRIQGLLWIEDRQWAKGQVALGESLTIVEQRLGADHWRTERARTELAQAVKI